MKNKEIEEALGGQMQVIITRSIFCICIISYILSCFIKNLDLSRILNYIVFFGFVFNGGYVGLKLFKHNNLKKNKN